MRYRICVPSYRKKRLKTVERYPEATVYVDAEDEQVARRCADDVVVVPDGVQGNLCRIRNYILDREFSEGADGVLILDDDISKVETFEERGCGVPGYSPTVLDMDGLWQLVADGMQLCKDWGYRFWGVNNTTMPNAYMRNTPFNTNAYICGPFQAFLRCRERYDEGLPLKEDYDMTLQQCRAHGGALRLNFAHVVCDQGCKTPTQGGCGAYRNTAYEVEQLKALQRKWGSRIVRIDGGSKKKTDINPIIKVPIKGV